MNLHLFIPALFWPDNSHPKIYYQLQMPALEAILAKSQYTESSQQAVDSWLCQTFGVAKQQDWPIASILLQLDGENMETKDDYWLCADPVHLRIENNHILLADSQILNISLKEAVSFADSINGQFSEDGLILLPFHPNRWYVRSSESPDLQTFPLSEVAGKNINNMLPAGRDSAAWNSRINEIQMLLHDHPLNRIREEQGELAINSLWIWGGGTRPRSQTVQTLYTELWSNHVLVRALAKMGETVCHDLPEDAAGLLRHSTVSDKHLVMLDSLHGHACYRNAYEWRNELAKLEQNWFIPLLDALKKKQIKQLIVTTINEHSTRNFMLTPGNLWKFWITARPLEAYG